MKAPLDPTSDGGLRETVTIIFDWDCDEANNVSAKQNCTVQHSGGQHNLQTVTTRLKQILGGVKWSSLFVFLDQIQTTEPLLPLLEEQNMQSVSAAVFAVRSNAVS